MVKSMNRIGIIGGLGPLATVKFMELLNEELSKSSKKVEMVVINNPKTPDRTSYILDNSKENPIDSILDMVKKLHIFNVDLIVMPCNTASYFYKEIINNATIPFINIVEETVNYVKKENIKKVGLLATSGTIKSNIYLELFNQYGIECIIPNEEEQKIVTDIIYNGIKKGEKIEISKFYKVVESLKKEGCEKIILGCTELSALNKIENLNDSDLIDAMEILAISTLKNLGIN